MPAQKVGSSGALRFPYRGVQRPGNAFSAAGRRQTLRSKEYTFRVF